MFLSQFPSLAKEVLHGDEQVASFLLMVFSLGVGIGALLCEMLNRRHVEIGLVPIGALGMTLFCVDLYPALHALPPAPPMGLAAFLALHAHWRVIADFGLLSLCTGLYSVPLYALIQLRSPETHRARIIAANNILNALFIIASSLVAAVLLHFDQGLADIFLFTGLANVLVAIWLFVRVPEFLLRCGVWLAAHSTLRLQLTGDAAIPVSGAAVLICQPTQPFDLLLLLAASPRPLHVVWTAPPPPAGLPGYLLRHGLDIMAVAPTVPGDAAPVLAHAHQVLATGELLCLCQAAPAADTPAVQVLHAELLQLARPLPVLSVTIKRPPALRRSRSVVQLRIGTMARV